MTDSCNNLSVSLENIIVLPNGIIKDRFGNNLPTFCIGVGSHRYNAVRINCVQELVHRIVATVYVPNPNGYNMVHHKDGNRFNNDYTNLMWVSPEEHAKIHKWGTAVYVFRDGKFVAKYDNHKECAKALGISVRSIYNKKCKGYTFEHA